MSDVQNKLGKNNCGIEKWKIRTEVKRNRGIETLKIETFSRVFSCFLVLSHTSARSQFLHESKSLFSLFFKGFQVLSGAFRHKKTTPVRTGVERHFVISLRTEVHDGRL